MSYLGANDFASDIADMDSDCSAVDLKTVTSATDSETNLNVGLDSRVKVGLVCTGIIL